MKQSGLFSLLVAWALTTMVCYAQSSGTTQEYANSLVSKVTDVVSLSQEQISALQTAALTYVMSAENANVQYATNDSLLIVTKKDAWQAYQQVFRQTLTEEQYNSYMQYQQVRQQELLNQLKQNQ